MSETKMDFHVNFNRLSSNVLRAKCFSNENRFSRATRMNSKYDKTAQKVKPLFRQKTVHWQLTIDLTSAKDEKFVKTLKQVVASPKTFAQHLESDRKRFSYVASKDFLRTRSKSLPLVLNPSPPLSQLRPNKSRNKKR